jgi:hypothetical protein
MAHRIRALYGVFVVLALALNLMGCAQTGTTQSGSVSQGGAYQQSQKAIWVDPQGSGESTDLGLYMDSQGGGR